MDVARRFGGVARLYGEAAAARFARAHVAVIGVGGVGSWAVEGLARSGVGRLTLMDLDNVAESNVNRQLPALDGEFGRAKVDVLAERIGRINPNCQVDLIEDFVSEQTLADYLAPSRAYDFVIDAIDDWRVKALMIVAARAQKLPIIVSGSAGGKMDVRQIEMADLSRTIQDPMLAKMRAFLRKHHGFPSAASGKNFGVECIFSREPVRYPEACAASDLHHGLHCGGFGSAVAVTASFGMFAAGRVLARLAQSL